MTPRDGLCRPRLLRRCRPFAASLRGKARKLPPDRNVRHASANHRAASRANFSPVVDPEKVSTHHGGCFPCVAGRSARIERVVTGRVRIREARLPPMRAVRTTRQFRDRRRARAAERRAEVERRAEIRALEALAAQLGAANVGALGESPSSPPATILASADRDALPADPHQALRLLQRECASLRAHARTVDARVQREVEAAPPSPPRRRPTTRTPPSSVDWPRPRGRRRRASRKPTPKRAPPAEGSTDVVRARHAAKISAAVADAVAAEPREAPRRSASPPPPPPPPPPTPNRHPRNRTK